MNAISDSCLKINNNCNINFKGTYFESFGDMFINIFDNIISKNKDLGKDLEINIDINIQNDDLELKVKNNLPINTDIKELDKKVEDVINKVANYKKGELTSSFEIGSGYLKICKCISADLERNEYIVEPRNTEDLFEVKIIFNIKNLIA